VRPTRVPGTTDDQFSPSVFGAVPRSIGHRTIRFVATSRGSFRTRLLRVFQIAEDTIHVLVGALLVILAGVLIVEAVSNLVVELRGPYNALSIVLSFLDTSLVLFIVAELLHTVRITIRDHILDAEPFLVVGIVAGVRKVLILTAEANGSFRWNPQGIELLILMGLILAMTVAITLWRHSKPPSDGTV
jgi:uncharacterized membrane protein (DUF373 family)